MNKYTKGCASNFPINGLTTMEMKKFILIIHALVSVLSVKSQTMVIDVNGEPMQGTVVISNSGFPVGVINMDGQLPQIDKSFYPLTLRCLGYENQIITSSVDSIVMKQLSHKQAESVGRNSDLPAMYMVYYIHEVISISDGVDTIYINSHYVADYMQPAYKGAKCSTWKTPRVLNKSVDVVRKNKEVMNDSDVSDLQGIPFLELDNDPAVFPTSLYGKEQGVEYGNTSKKGGKTTHRITPTTYIVTCDALAGRNNHKASFAIFKLLGLSLEVTELWKHRVYPLNEDNSYELANATGLSLFVRINGLGKWWKNLFQGGNLPVIMQSYIEVYPIEKTYHTKAEAKQMKKVMPKRTIEIPDTAKW